MEDCVSFRCKIQEMTSSNHLRKSNLRPINVSSDLNQVADLIELCFRGAMDDDGYDYIHYLRRMAKDFVSDYWGFSGFQQRYAPMQGFVYTVDEQLVGNLTIIPFRKSGQLIYLIANVAVHPDFRRGGIARLLTAKALEYVRSRSSYGAWLQVRDDNQAAQALYLSMGFRERVRRSTWTYKPIERMDLKIEHKFPIQTTKLKDWEEESALLKSVYPDLVRWNLGIKLDRFNPSFLATISRFFKGQIIRNQTITKSLSDKAFFVFEKSSLFSDNLWVACQMADDEHLFPPLLDHLVNKLKTRKPFIFNFPAYRSEELLQELGFVKNHTLIWMEEIDK